MNPHTADPMMFILKADPARYIRTTPAAVAALLKAAEGMAALLCCFRMFSLLREMLGGQLRQGPMEVLAALLPEELARPLTAGLSAPQGKLWTALGAVTALCLLAELACLAAEGAAAPVLRFAMKGEKIFRVTRRTVLACAAVLVLCLTAACVPAVIGAVRSGLQPAEMLRALAAPLVTAAAGALHLSYSRGAAEAMRIVEYELRMGFKETAMNDVHLGRDAFLLGVLFLAAAAVLHGSVGQKTLYTAVPAMVALKSFAVWRCWRGLLKCHR